MLLTISTTHRPATDLGYLLHKHPDRLQSFSMGVGKAHVFYPEATEGRCTVALLLSVDPVGLVRRGRDSSGFALAEYVNDRPYVASSLLSVALVTAFKTAMAGICAGHEELAGTPIPLEAKLPVVPARGGAALVHRLFTPLGYDVETAPVELDSKFPEWGASEYVSLILRAESRLVDLLNHLYVLIPVMDDRKHYWVDEAEIEKLLRRGDGWLPGHPERDLITRRYLKKQPGLYFPALASLDEQQPAAEADEEAGAGREEQLEEQTSLRDQRLDAVRTALRTSGARRVLDLGCGPGALLSLLLNDGYEELVGADVSARSLEIAAKRLHLDEMHDAQRDKIRLLQSPLTYRDKRFRGFDAAVLMEVIEHIDLARLPAAEQNVFGSARPATVLVTTPNAEYNVKWETLPAGELRHSDHRFEWTREQFQQWADHVCSSYGYTVSFTPIGPEDETVGPPTQMAVFSR